MSGGKGGSNEEKTEIPAWIRDPAIRNLARAEDVQRIEYMPYYGGDVAAFTPAQNAAFDTNIGAAEAFGLLAPDTLTATSGMPTPTDFDGFSGYSSQPMYESALAELKANQPGAVAQYDRLFGGNVPTTWGNNPRFRGSAAGGGGNTTDPENRWVDKASHIMDTQDKERDRGTALESGVEQAQDYYNAAVAAGTEWDKPRGYTPAEAKLYDERAKAHTDTQGTIMKLPQKPVSYPTLGQQQALRNMTPVSTAGQGLPWQKKKVDAVPKLKFVEQTLPVGELLAPNPHTDFGIGKSNWWK